MHGPQMRRAECERVQHLQQGEEQETLGVRGQEPAQDPAGASEQHQLHRTDGSDRAPGVPEQDDLGDHTNGPEQADLAVVQTDRAPVDRPEAVEHGERSAVEPDGDNEEQEHGLAQQGEGVPPLPLGPGEADVGKLCRDQRRHPVAADHQPQDDPGRQPFQQPARAVDGGDEGHRAPEPDPSVVDVPFGRGGHGQVVAQRQDRRVETGGGDGRDHEGRETVAQAEAGIGRTSADQEDDERRPPLSRTVRPAGRDRIGQRLHPHGNRQDQADLPGIEPARLQIDRKPGHRHPGHQKDRGIEGGEADRPAERRPRRAGQIRRAHLLNCSDAIIPGSMASTIERPRGAKPSRPQSVSDGTFPGRMPVMNRSKPYSRCIRVRARAPR